MEYQKHLRGMHQVSVRVNGRERVLPFICLWPQAHFLLLALLKLKSLHFLLEGKTGFIWSQTPPHPRAPALTNLPLHKTEHYLESFAEEAARGWGVEEPFVCWFRRGLSCFRSHQACQPSYLGGLGRIASSKPAWATELGDSLSRETLCLNKK